MAIPGDICVAESHRDIRVCAYSQQQVCRVLHPLSASVTLNALETTDLIASTVYLCAHAGRHIRSVALQSQHASEYYTILL